MSPDDDDFYEDDEPIEQVRAEFARAKKVFTTPPSDSSRSAYLGSWTPVMAATETANLSTGQLVAV